MVGGFSSDGGSICGRTVDPCHPQHLSPEGTGDMPAGQPLTCAPVPHAGAWQSLVQPDGVEGALPCTRTHVHRSDRRASGAAAAGGQPGPVLEKASRRCDAKHASFLSPPSQCPGGPSADGQWGYNRPVRSHVLGLASGHSAPPLPREPTWPSPYPLAF